MSLKHNTYFDGKAQSVAFERNGQRISSGVVEAGEYTFNTEAPERMTVTSGAMEVRLAGQSAFVLYPMGTAFEIAGKSSFDVRISAPVAYVCEYF